MDGLPFPTTASTINTSFARPLFSFTTTRGRTRNLSFLRKPKFLVFASKDDPKLDQWDQMELKFGRLLGEDPKLTLAKIMGRKSNPDMSYLEIEKAFNKKEGKILDGVEEVHGSNSKEEQSLNSSNGLNLVRPVPKKGVKFESNYNPVVSEAKKPSQPVGKNVDNSKSSIPNVILRRPSTLGEDDVETGKSSKLRIKPNLSLRMGKEQTRKFSDITLLKKPELTNINPNNNDQRSFGDMKAKVYDDVEETTLEIGSLSTETTSNATLFDKPERMNLDSNIDQGKEFSADLIGSNSHRDLKENSLKGIDGSDETVNTTKINFEESPEARDASVSVDPLLDSQSATGLQPLEQSVKGSDDKGSSIIEPPEKKLVGSGIHFYMEAALQGKPKRFDQSVKEASSIGRETTFAVNPENYGNSDELENFLATSPLKEHEDTDWKRAENLVRAGGREEVELISSSTRGFVVSFGSLIGFLPYRNLAARWKFLAFESWLRRKGLDPSVYKQNLGIIGSFEITNKSSSLDPSLIPETDHEVEAEISPDMKLEDLLRIYDQEKLKFLSSFVGQKIKVNVVFADRKSRRLIFSVKPKEKEELVEKKRSLMAKLSIGDVVKCCIKKITYFGIFVEVDGVPALIHQTEVSWDATLDPATYFKIGQIVEAKVHQLDFSLERIFLSLKEITPDPLSETLEAVIGDNDSLVGTLEAAEADTEWAEVESIIEELQRFEGIQYVSKGRFFLSPGLAPTFQVYMASMFENQYKLLARSGNKIQEVIVQTSLGKEEMKSAILTCTNRVV